MSKRETDAGQKQANKDAVDAVAADIAQKAEPELARYLSGGGSRPTSEQSAYIAAETARCHERGEKKPMAQIIEEARRRR
jgi:hypothetical protein